MSLVSKNDAGTLTEELVSAREKYNANVNSVLDRAQSRRSVIGSTISDLKAEDESLAGVVEQARKA